MPANPTKLTIRLDQAELDQLRDTWHQTYPEHRLAWGAWLLSRLLG